MSATPTVEEMVHDLHRLGWRQKRLAIWESPLGRLYLGPYQAWRVATGNGEKASP